MDNLVRSCSDTGSRRDILIAQARQLSSWLLGDEWDRQLDSVQELLIETDGHISRMPWPALVRSNGHYWSEDFAVRVRVGGESPRSPKPSTRLSAGAKALVVGAPAIAGDADLAPLPNALEEAERIHTLFPRSIFLSGPQATITSVRERLSADIQLFHFAGHGYGGDGGGIVLTGVNGGPSLLTATGSENPGFVSLSAGCAIRLFHWIWRTWRSSQLGPGVPSIWIAEVVASSWDLDSAATSILMREFYRELLSGAPPAEALRRAGGKVRAERLYAHPYHWAALQVFSRD